jgi:hypothetical protein
VYPGKRLYVPARKGENMRRVALMALTVAVLAMSGIAAGIASAAKLTLSEGGAVLATGAFFEAYGYNSLSVNTSLGAIECEYYFVQTHMELNVVTNSKGTDELEIGRVNGGGQEACRSFTGNAFFHLESLDGPLKLRASGKATTGAVALLIEFEHVTYQEERYSDVECFFSAKRLTGSNTATTNRQPLAIELEGQLKLDRSLSSENAKHICPKTAELSMSFPLTENEEGEEEIEEQLTTEARPLARTPSQPGQP